MAADDLKLQGGTHLLHIGPHKTGSSAVQSALHLARKDLAAHGVVYPGRGRHTLWPILAVTGQPALLGEPPPKMVHWENLVNAVTEAGDQRVIVSSEFLSEASDEAVERVVRELGGQKAHVVVTLRPLAKIMPSQWQQYVQNGFRMSYGEWLTGILSQPPSTPTPGFWRRHRHDELVSRWGAAAGLENLTVVVVDESDRRMLLHTFETMLGLPDGFLMPEDRAENRSLTAAEVEIVRMINHEFKRRGWPERNYSKYMRYGAVMQMKSGRHPAPEEPRIITPAWAHERAAEIGAEMAKNIAALGVRVVGDLSTLGAVQAEPLSPAPGTGAAGLVPAQATSAEAAESVTLLPGPATAGTSTGLATAAADAGAAPGTTENPAAGLIVARTTADAEEPAGGAFRLAESPVEVSGMIPSEAAAHAIVGAFVAGGIGGRTVEESVYGIPTKTLARVVIRRSRQGARRKFRLPRR